MGKRDSLLNRVLSAIVTLAMAASMVPTQALAEMTAGGGVL